MPSDDTLIGEMELYCGAYSSDENVEPAVLAKKKSRMRRSSAVYDGATTQALHHGLDRLDQLLDSASFQNDSADVSTPVDVATMIESTLQCRYPSTLSIEDESSQLAPRHPMDFHETITRWRQENNGRAHYR